MSKAKAELHWKQEIPSIKQSNSDGQFTNINLNHGQKCFIHDVQEFSKSKNDKTFGYNTVTSEKSYQEKGNKSKNFISSKFSKKKNVNLNDLFIGNKENQTRKDWESNDYKMDDNSDKYSSTLSLDISACKNSVHILPENETSFSNKFQDYSSMLSSNRGRPPTIVGSNLRRTQQSRTMMSSSYGNAAPSFRNFSSNDTSTSSTFFGQSAHSYATPSTFNGNQTFSTTASTAKTFEPTKIGGFDTTGEDIQKRLNSAYKRRNKNTATPQIPTFQGYTIPEEELMSYYVAHYKNGEGQLWAITEIIKASPNKELLWKHLKEIYYFLYGQELDERKDYSSMLSSNRGRPPTIVGSNLRRTHQSRTVLSSSYGNTAPRTSTYRNFSSNDTSTSSTFFGQSAYSYAPASTFNGNPTFSTTATTKTKKYFSINFLFIVLKV